MTKIPIPLVKFIKEISYIKKFIFVRKNFYGTTLVRERNTTSSEHNNSKHDSEPAQISKAPKSQLYFVCC